VRSVLVAAVIVVAARDAAADFALTFSSDPHPGIHRETWTDTTIPARVRLISIDLSAQGLELFATEPAHQGIATTDYSTFIGAAVAINGDSFAVDYTPRGLAVGTAPAQMPMQWAGTADDTYSGFLDFSRVPNMNGGTHTFAEIVPPEQVKTFNALPAGTQGVISGRPMLVRAGIVETQYDCTDATTIPCERAPRTAVALSADGITMWVAVVDGWQSASAGLTDEELAAFLAAHGADSALALDPASSATLVVDGTLISSPSDGVERPVANHLAVKYGSLPAGDLIGVICHKTISPCNPIAGATVTLDNGATQMTNTNGVFDFPNLVPRYVCATASATGYCPQTRCVYVSSGAMNYDSMGLDPTPAGGCPKPPPDAGVDAFVVPPDSPPLHDARGGDGPNGLTGPGGGCCGAGRDRPDVLVWALVAWFLGRRRGTRSRGA
jgi:hypothetical protein